MAVSSIMFATKWKVYILIVILFYCGGIELDYYIDDTNSKGISVKSESRRNIEENVAGNLTSSYDDDHETFTIKYYYKKRQNPKLRLRYETVLNNISEGTNKKVEKLSSVTNDEKRMVKSDSLSISKLFEDDYSNDYDNKDVTLENADKIQTDHLPHRKQKASKVRSDEFMEPFIAYYNLNPVSGPELKKLHLTNLSNNIWYVPQNTPCWELPIIYGEFSNRKLNNDVFTMYKEKLMNVKDYQASSKLSFRSADVPMVHSVNKWCEVEPCYGDHTLCLFANNKYNKTCEKDYHVKIPKVMEQLSIVNTINSMRNRVSNGLSHKYSHLPTASNMKQILYDHDLEKMSKAWLQQCLPGPAPCSALNGSLVTELECTKYIKHCCRQPNVPTYNCKAKTECFLFAVIGCIHLWFEQAGKQLIKRDMECGRATASTFATVQLLWAETNKVGCAYGESPNGDVRVICNFSPGAPFFVKTYLYCGIISFTKMRKYDRYRINLTKEELFSRLGLKWQYVKPEYGYGATHKISVPMTHASSVDRRDWRVNTLNKIYVEGWARNQSNDWINGTRNWIALLVAKYEFIDRSESRCDTEESIYKSGKPGSLCIERGRTFQSLCDDFSEPSPGYRLIALIAPMLLFSLMLYDLFSGVVRQTNS